MLSTGLSPRVRGNLFHPCGYRARSGSIPARAGEPYVAVIVGKGAWVYPRACGGTVNVTSMAKASPGLSPRVRGNPADHRAAQHLRGSIPARAGEPRAVAATTALFTVYPRACGGTGDSGSVSEFRRGLSPRVRGNHCAEHVRPLGGRSIPARAGEPGIPAAFRNFDEVYPRACGGTKMMPWPTANSPGLSPRVRGNRIGLGKVSPRLGSIPARAGEPGSAVRRPDRREVYPRACGGTRRGSTTASATAGLSPRVRGNPRAPRRRQRCTRSIPARAGEPF